ncbi:MAG TPA: ABC transporter permease [Bacteroidia bacterium]
MRTIKFLLEKEFKQIFRNKSILIMIMVMPVMQLILMPLAADYEVKNINLSVVDDDHSETSRKMINEIFSSGYFKAAGFLPSYQKAIYLIEKDKADLILHIPAGFDKKLIREKKGNVFIAVNAINGVKANLGANYLNAILRQYNISFRQELIGQNASIDRISIQTDQIYRFNPNMNYRYFMVPGILAILVTMVGGFLTALNIVKEKEVGTIEQINVTPIKKHHFILGKLIPFWVLGNVVFSIGLLVAYLVYGIVPVGNLIVLYGFIALYLLVVLGFGLLISTISQTQQQAMFIMFFFMMVFILMGGLFTPIESMPDWAQTVTRFNPMSYFINVLRMVILKGSSWSDISNHLLVMAAFAIGLNFWAVRNYSKTS